MLELPSGEPLFLQLIFLSNVFCCLGAQSRYSTQRILAETFHNILPVSLGTQQIGIHSNSRYSLYVQQILNIFSCVFQFASFVAEGGCHLVATNRRANQVYYQV